MHHVTEKLLRQPHAPHFEVLTTHQFCCISSVVADVHPLFDVHPPSLEINAKRCPQRCRSSGLEEAALCTSFKAELYSSCRAGFCMGMRVAGSCCVLFLQSQERSQDVLSISRFESQPQTTKYHPRLLAPREHPYLECPGLHQSVTYQCPAIAAKVLHVNNSLT